jgi:hypothetical protein
LRSPGKYRGALPDFLTDRFDAILGDPEITSLDRAIALIDLRIEATLQGLDIGDSALLWQRIRAAADTLGKWVLQDAVPASDDRMILDAPQRDSLLELLRLINHGVNERAAWDEVVNLVERRRRLASAETRRRHLDREVYSRAQVLAWQEAINAAVQEHVIDPATLEAIERSANRRLADATTPG